MTEYIAVRNPKRCPTHPGQLLARGRDSRDRADEDRDRLAARDFPAASLRHPRGAEARFACRRGSAGKLFGDGPGIWIRMQGAYDTWQAEQTVDVSGIPTIRAA